MCDKCSKHKTHWIHIADGWTEEEKREMITRLLGSNYDLLVALCKEKGYTQMRNLFD